MESYLSGRGSNAYEGNSDESASSFSSYLTDPNKQLSEPAAESPTQNNLDTETELVHQDDSGIKVEVVSVDGSPVNILIHIPDGRIIDLNCEY